MNTCTECNGKGKVLLLTSEVPCAKCGGTGTIPATVPLGGVNLHRPNSAEEAAAVRWNLEPIEFSAQDLAELTPLSETKVLYKVPDGDPGPTGRYTTLHDTRRALADRGYSPEAFDRLMYGDFKAATGPTEAKGPAPGDASVPQYPRCPECQSVMRPTFAGGDPVKSARLWQCTGVPLGHRELTDKEAGVATFGPSALEPLFKAFSKVRHDRDMDWAKALIVECGAELVANPFPTAPEYAAYAIRAVRADAADTERFHCATAVCHRCLQGAPLGESLTGHADGRPCDAALIWLRWRESLEKLHPCGMFSLPLFVAAINAQLLKPGYERLTWAEVLELREADGATPPEAV